jgi:hypothetical protein
MTTESYYTMILQEARKAHSAAVREARKWRYGLRRACMEDAREWRAFAHNCIGIIRQSRQELRQ